MAGRDFTEELFGSPSGGRDFTEELFGKPKIAPIDVDPTSGMDTGQKYLAGMGKSFVDTATGLKQRLDEGAAGLESLVPGGAAISRFFGGKSAAEIRDAGQQAINDRQSTDKALMQTGAGVLGNITGGMATGAALGPLGAVGMGAGMGFATPTSNGPTEAITNMGVGAGAGYLGDKAVQGVSRMFAPKVAPEVQKLIDEGVNLTPGQIMGGNIARFESKMTSAPFVGDAIANAQRRGGEELNRVAFNRALSPIGEKLPMNIPVGREAVKYTDDALGAAYDKLLPKLTTQADQQFGASVQSLEQMVQNGALDPKYANLFSKTLKTRVIDKFQGQNAMTGQTLKDVESFLGNEIKRFGISQDPDARLLADAYQQLQAEIRGLVSRTNPQYAKELKDINTGWANFKRVQRAAAGLGAEDGVFTPAQLENAVKALDRSKDKARFAEGKALMQDLSGAAKSVMGQKYPDSGTAGRAMNVGALASGFYNPAIPLGLAAGSAAYAPPIQKMIQGLLTQRPELLRTIGAGVADLSPYGGLLGSSLALNQ
jgi:hypothetical protein